MSVLRKTNEKVIVNRKKVHTFAWFFFYNLQLDMEKLKTYRIDLKNLLPAINYSFNYVLGDDFFEFVDGTEVSHGNVNVLLSVVRASSAFELKFHIDGTVRVTCDRCLDEMEIPIATENRLIATFGETYAEISDEHIVISEEKGFIDVAWYMYEFIALAIPVKHVHEPGKCNEMMVLKLRELSVDERDDDDDLFRDTEDSGEIGSAGNEGADTVSGKNCRPADPRWEVLRDLIGDN
jgi:uncharacterized metal-binding protein YceD (DUF177 family)